MKRVNRLFVFVAFVVLGALSANATEAKDILTEVPKHWFSFVNAKASGKSTVETLRDARYNRGEVPLTISKSGGVSFGDSDHGGAMFMDGTAHRGPYSKGNEVLFGTGDWTVHARVKTAATGPNRVIWNVGWWKQAQYALVLTTDGVDGSRGISLALHNGDSGLHIGDRIDVAISDVNVKYHDYDAVYVKAEDRVYLHVDGVRAAGSIPFTPQSGYWQIFSHDNGEDEEDHYGKDAAMEDFRFYQRALTQDEIDVLHGYTVIDAGTELTQAYTVASGEKLYLNATGKTLNDGDVVFTATGIATNGAVEIPGGVVKLSGDTTQLSFFDPKVTTARWTGAAGDGDITKPGNWSCANASNHAVEGALPAECATVYFTGSAIAAQITNTVPWRVVNVNGRLGADCDWSGLGTTPIAEGSTINVKGHNLTLSTVFSGTVTDTTTGDPGSLTMVVAENAVLTNTTLSIQGNLTFVKEGAGIFDGRVKNQLYTGGTVVNAGAITSNESEMNLHWGESGTTVMVNADGVLDVRNDLSWCFHKIVLNGGAISNATGSTRSDVQGIGDIELLADSKVISGFDTVFSDNRAGRVGVIDLGGHTLEFVHLENPDDDESIFCFYSSVISNGTLRFHRKATFNPCAATCIGDDVTLDMQGDIYLGGCDITVRNLIDGSRGDTQTPESNGRVHVTGRYTPKSDHPVNVTLVDGATIDLTERTGTWSLAQAFPGGGGTVSFAEGARVWVDVTGRTLKGGDRIISWTAKPNANLKVTPETMDVVVWDDGLYRGIEDGVMVAVASGKGTVTIPMDWVTAHATGETPEERRASLIAPRTEGNGITLRDNFVLGLDPEDPLSIPVICPVQSSNPDIVVLKVVGLDVHPESGAIIRYQLMEKTSLDGEYVAVTTQESNTFEVGLPASGAKYYQVNVIVTTSEAMAYITQAPAMK